MIVVAAVFFKAGMGGSKLGGGRLREETINDGAAIGSSVILCVGILLRYEL